MDWVFGNGSYIPYLKQDYCSSIISAEQLKNICSTYKSNKINTIKSNQSKNWENAIFQKQIMRSSCIEKGIWTSSKPLKILKGGHLVASNIVLEWYNIFQNKVKEMKSKLNYQTMEKKRDLASTGCRSKHMTRTGHGNRNIFSSFWYSGTNNTSLLVHSEIEEKENKNPDFYDPGE